MSLSMQAQAKLFLAFAKKVNDPAAMLSATEEAAIATFLPPTGGLGTGLPGAPAGDARGSNELRRTNWFNGRFLTAEALRRQDGYFDLRARLEAHALMPGVAYGLGIDADAANGMPVFDLDRQSPPTAGGFAKTRPITLSPGLAFDHVGRPILVSQPFRFTLEQLLSVSRNSPRRVAPGGIDFAPCVCLVPDPAGPTGGSPALRPGPYLLIIEPGETLEGEAKVYGEACAGPAPTTCQSESWRGGFGLSLVRVPLELPNEPGLNSAWALRGTASAWWFDVFEHSLIKRWDPTFATDDGFGAPADPGRHEAGAIALAMVWLGTDGSALFIDRWIPRRSIAATPGEDWHRARFGASPRAAAWARIHQFQAMLAESLRMFPLVSPHREPATINLWQRGFRHIPPIGFLPLDPAAIGAVHHEGGTTGIAVLDRIIAASGGRIQLVSGLIAAAKRQAASYFRGTTVLSYCVVALHDDDILEDLSNVFDKDPVQIAQRATVQTAPAAVDPATGAAGNIQGGTAQSKATNAFIETAGNFFDLMGLDELVNRRTEIVKVVIPLQGLSRAHPVLGVVPEDARDQAADWLGTQPPSWWTSNALLMDARSMAQLQQRLPLEMLPRHFAVYVKQRMVLLDVLVMLVELLQAMLVLARDTQRAAQQAVPPQQQALMLSTNDYRTAYQAQPAERRAVVEAAFAEPLVRTAVARAAVFATPDLRVPARNAAFAAQVAQTEQQLTADIPDATARQQAALARVSDAYAAEHSGFAVMQVLAAVQPPAQAKQMTEAIARQAAQQPLRDVTGARAEATVADRVAKDGVVVFARPEAAAVYGAMREAVAERDVRQFVADAPAGITAREILSQPPEQAAQTLGGADRLAAFTAAMAEQTREAAAAAEAVTAAPPAPDVIEKVRDAIAGGQDATAAIETAKASAGGDAARIAFLNGASTLVKTLGADRTLQISRLAALRRPS